MEWYLFLILSVSFLFVSILLAIIGINVKHRKFLFADSSKILFAGVALSIFCLFFPIYRNTFDGVELGIAETILVSLYNTIRMFAVDGEIEFVFSNLIGLPQFIQKSYTLLFSIHFVLAPVLAFGFLLSFFKNVSGYITYLTHYSRDVYIFSTLNEKSLALAKSIYENDKKNRLIVFTKVNENEGDNIGELLNEAKEIGAVCFKKDINSINFATHSKKSVLNFFTIGEDEAKNIDQALNIVENFRNREYTNLYVFSTQVDLENMLATAFRGDDDSKIKVRYINEVQSFVMRNLYENGYERLFESAIESDSGIKEINAVVVGMGRFGTEMVKDLSWYCQMDGYKLRIHAFDENPLAEDIFTSKCPELMAMSAKEIYGEPYYTIDIHSGINVNTNAFDEMINALPKVTYVFVALGSDEDNVSASLKLRSLFERKGDRPVIEAVVFSADKAESLKGVTNFKGQPYDISFIGDRERFYTEEELLDSDIEEEALSRHTKWGKESDFWRYNYNYKSSIASAIHKKARLLCNVKGADKAPKERSEEELKVIRVLEHNRWNAYMRSEGYVYGGTIDSKGRNDLAKTHNYLVPFDALPPEVQAKDDD